MYEDNVQVCAILRNFESNSEYLHFGDFWIQNLSEDDKKSLRKHLKYFINYPYDNHLVGKWYYIGRGKSRSVLSDNTRFFFSPLFLGLKLFKTGNIILPFSFYSHKGIYRETQLHGDNYGIGYGLDRNPYIFNKEDMAPYINFEKKLKDYSKYLDAFFQIPYLQKPKILEAIDLRISLAKHILLKASIENNYPYHIFDKLIDYTVGFESLYLLKNERGKKTKLSTRISTLLCKSIKEEEELNQTIKRFYDIRSNIIHASLIVEENNKFLSSNIYNYENILRKSILAFLDLNLHNSMKEAVINIIDEAAKDSSKKVKLRKSLMLLKLAL